jgi:uncharacterized protein YjcR
MTHICGAKTRQGTICKNKPMLNGRCRFHGGKSTGPKDKEKHRKSMMGNKNSLGYKNNLKTGEYENIVFDNLTPEEKEYYNRVSLDLDTQIDNEIRLLEIREGRMLKYLNMAQEGFDNEEIETTYRHVKGKGLAMVQKVVRNRNVLEQLTKIHEALTRVQEKKSKLIELKLKTREENKGDGESLAQFVEVFNKAIERYGK